jgi:hypothetical protein
MLLPSCFLFLSSYYYSVSKSFCLETRNNGIAAENQCIAFEILIVRDVETDLNRSSIHPTVFPN